MRKLLRNARPASAGRTVSGVWPGSAFGGACAVIWGVQALAAKRSVVDGLTPGDVTILRFAVAGVLLLPIALRLKPVIVGSLGWRRVIVLAMLAGPLYSLLIVGGVAFSPALHSTVIGLGLVPLLSIGITRIFVGDRISIGQMAGAGAAVAGLMLFSRDVMSAAPHREAAWLGDLMFVATASMWATFGVLLKRWRASAIAVSASVCFLSLLALPILAMILPLRLASASVSVMAFHGFYQGVLVVCVSLMLYARAVALLGAMNAAMFVPLAPVVTLLCEAVIGETPTPQEAIGALVVTLGVMIALNAGRAAIPAESFTATPGEAGVKPR